MKPTWTTGIAAMMIAATAVGCSFGDGGRSDRGASNDIGARHATACDHGSYTWFNVSRRAVVTDMDQGRYDKGEALSTKRLKQIASYTRSVRTGNGAELPSTTVYRSLAAHLKTGEGLAGDGTNERGRTTKDEHDSWAYRKAESPGRYVTARAVPLVEADFQYRCPGDPAVTGHVVTWEIPSEIIVECGRKPEKNRDDGEREAARLGCRKGDPAVA
ncbi:hypothetical protein [Streptomyces antioxidans]|nr:hypothetical protein [Streptomyces antioxidans]